MVADAAPDHPGENITEQPRQPDLQPIRARALLLILILLPAGVFFNVWGCWVAGGVGWTDSLIGSAVGALAILTAVNVGLRRWRPRWTLSRAEVIAVYMALVIGVGMTASVWDWGGSVATVITWPVWNAGPENQWQDLIWPNIPAWLVVTNRDLLAGFFLGDASPYRVSILLAWLQPALWWTAWAAALLWVSMCLNVIIRRRWSQEEQLPFPMTILPLQMTEPRTRLFDSPLWWIGVIASASLALFNLVSRFIPAFPAIPTSFDLGPFITNNRPWDALRTPTLDWELWHIGLSYLMPVDLAFSMIVFNLAWRSEYVISRILGWTVNAWAGFPYGDQQTIGSFSALMISVVWLDRRYLLQVVRKALGLSSLADDRGEAFSYRTAVFGALFGLAFLWYFLSRAGMTRLVIGIFLALYFIMAMVMSRMRAHLGPPNHEMYGAMPEFALTQFPGTRALGPRGMGILAILRPYMGEQRPNPAPAQLEGLRMAERAAINPTHLAFVMMAVVPLTMLLYFWASVHVGYQLGLGTAKVSRQTIFVARDTSEKLDSWLRAPGGPSWGGVEAIGVGFVGTLLLMGLKLRFPGWPVHPVAFPLAFGYPIDVMMPAIVAAFVIKLLLLRYGGLRAHRRALPFFLGLLAGSATVGLLQSIVFRALRLPP
jgi:hypothetical protein